MLVQAVSPNVEPLKRISQFEAFDSDSFDYTFFEVLG